MSETGEGERVEEPREEGRLVEEGVAEGPGKDDGARSEHRGGLGDDGALLVARSRERIHERVCVCRPCRERRVCAPERVRRARRKHRVRRVHSVRSRDSHAPPRPPHIARKRVDREIV